MALAAHNQLVEMCQQLLSKLDEHSATARTIDFGELEQLKGQLRGICQETIPEDVMQLESQTSLGLLKLDQIVSKERSLSSLQMEEKSGGLYRGLSLADLMTDLKTSIAAMEIHATEGSDVHAANPTALERARINEKLAGVTARIMEALEHVASLSSTGGLPPSSTAWFHSCFNGIDGQINSRESPLKAKVTCGCTGLEEMGHPPLCCTTTGRTGRPGTRRNFWKASPAGSTRTGTRGTTDCRPISV